MLVAIVDGGGGVLVAIVDGGGGGIFLREKYKVWRVSV